MNSSGSTCRSVFGVARAFVPLLAVIAGGCTAHRTSLPLRVPSKALSRNDAVSRALRDSPPPPRPIIVTSETTDPRLAAALARLSQRETPEAHRAVAAEYVRLRILDAADKHLSRAVQLGGNRAASYDARARLRRDAGFPGLALGDAYRALYLRPESPEAQNTLGTVLEAMGRLEDARRSYARVLQMRPGAWFALNNMCHVETRLGRQTAVATCQKALFASPASAVARNNLALAYAVAGDFARARENFAVGGNSATAAYNMGIVYMAAHQFDRAASEFRTSWQANPSVKLTRDRLIQATTARQP